MAAGIEAMNVCAGTACVDVRELAKHRGLDMRRFANLLMREKSVALPSEDPVTYGVNAARPIVERLSASERGRIELLITCSESGIDFSKSLSTYIHHYLGLSRHCRLFEIKQACYAGTAGLQMAVNLILAQTSPGARALVVATDLTRTAVPEGMDVGSQDWAYAEPSSGAGAVALLVGPDPVVFRIDAGAQGYYGYEVMDTCRPAPDEETGDAELSLLSYLDCCEQTFRNYQTRVSEVDYARTFEYLAFHAPFGGMVRGAHRMMMRKVTGAAAVEIEKDFERRVMPGLVYCQRVGNIMSAMVLLSLASTIDNIAPAAARIGCFSYGSGCCAEFYSGTTTAAARNRQSDFAIARQLDARHSLTIAEYESILRANVAMRFGTRDLTVSVPVGLRFNPTAATGQERLALTRIRNFHREYEWQS